VKVCAVAVSRFGRPSLFSGSDNIDIQIVEKASLRGDGILFPPGEVRKLKKVRE
jgi:hypothetical protein